MAGAARHLGVHPNTVRTWTDQGRLRCLRINARGDRRYRTLDLDAFIARASRDSALRTTAAVARFRSTAQPARDPAAAVSWPVPAARRLAWDRAPADLADVVATRLAEATGGPALAMVREGFGVLAEIARMTTAVADLDTTLGGIARILERTYGYRSVTFAECRGAVAVPRDHDGRGGHGRALSLEREPFAGALERRRATLVSGSSTSGGASDVRAGAGSAVVAPIIVGSAAWGLLMVTADRATDLGEDDVALLGAVANQVAAGVENDRLLRRVRRQLHQASALRHISADISSKLDLQVILSDLVDHAMVLFRADRGAAFLVAPDGTAQAPVSRNLSPAYLEFVRSIRSPSIGGEAIETHRSVFAVGYADDPRGAGVRAAVVQEGFDTIAAAPLIAGGESLGVLVLYHDKRHDWDPADLEVLDALAMQAGIALTNAKDYSRMAGWAAQLQSIQSLASRLSGLLTVREIGIAMANEFHQVIDYHSIRVYRIEGEDIVPVAWRGDAGVYDDEQGGENLRGRIGHGVIGWVAQNLTAVHLADAAHDPRAVLIPGTPMIDESMLVAPMLYEGDCLGVIALSKLGIGTFTGDDERLLGIYASFAAQAMANADANERLRRQSEALAHQLSGQRELLRVTESILTTLDPRAVLEEIADSLGSLVQADNLGIDTYDAATHMLQPILARGVHQALYLARPLSDDEGVAGWVVRHGVAQLVPDTLGDPRVFLYDDASRGAGTLIVVPLRGRTGMAGVMILERLGADARFSDEEFELVQIFAGWASIALQNAEIHHEVEVRAQTDALTGLWNQGTFHEMLARAIARGGSLSVLMLDLDRFKAYNDRRGHQAGDVLLQRIARALTGACREADAVFRYGGDEFALILPATVGAGADAVARKVADAVRATGRRRSSGPSVSASIGIATFPVDGSTREALLLAADRACYAAKRGGGDRIATATEGDSLAGEFLPTPPTPVDEATDTA